MGAVARLVLEFGAKYYKVIMRLIGEGWSVNQIEKYLKRH